MLERKLRRWPYLTMDEVKAKNAASSSLLIWNDDLESEMLDSSDRLVGKTVSFTFEDGVKREYYFDDIRNLHWSEGAEKIADVYNAAPVPGHDEMLYLHHYRSGNELPQCSDIVFDFETGYAVDVEAFVGNPENPREVMHSIRFGSLDGVIAPEGAFKPEYTSELVGKSVYWKHPGGEGKGIQYIFSSQKYYTYCMRFLNAGQVWMSTNPADYIKIKDGLYFMTVLEERQTGVQLCMLMNLDILSDVQTGFGIGGPVETSNRLETWMRSKREGSLGEPFSDLR